MNISEIKALCALVAVAVISSGLTHFCDPSIRALTAHGISVRDHQNGKESNLYFRVAGSEVAMMMEFDRATPFHPSSFNVMDLAGTMICSRDIDRDGRIDMLNLTVTRDGFEYGYADPHLDGDFSRMVKVKDGIPVENVLKIDGKWLAAKPAGTKAIVVIEGKETVVDPHTTPIKVLGLLAPRPAAISGGKSGENAKPVATVELPSSLSQAEVQKP